MSRSVKLLEMYLKKSVQATQCSPFLVRVRNGPEYLGSGENREGGVTRSEVLQACQRSLPAGTFPRYHLMSTYETQTHFLIGLSQNSNLDSICCTTMKCIPESLLQESRVVLITCTFFLSFGPRNLDLVCVDSLIHLCYSVCILRGVYLLTCVLMCI